MRAPSSTLMVALLCMTSVSIASDSSDDGAGQKNSSNRGHLSLVIDNEKNSASQNTGPRHVKPYGEGWNPVSPTRSQEPRKTRLNPVCKMGKNLLTEIPYVVSGVLCYPLHRLPEIYGRRLVSRFFDPNAKLTNQEIKSTARYIASLESDDFDAREKAERRLLAEREALVKEPSAKARKPQLLGQLTTLFSEKKNRKEAERLRKLKVSQYHLLVRIDDFNSDLLVLDTEFSRMKEKANSKNPTVTLDDVTNRYESKIHLKGQELRKALDKFTAQNEILTKATGHPVPLDEKSKLTARSMIPESHYSKSRSQRTSVRHIYLVQPKNPLDFVQ